MKKNNIENLNLELKSFNVWHFIFILGKIETIHFDKTTNFRIHWWVCDFWVTVNNYFNAIAYFILRNIQNCSIQKKDAKKWINHPKLSLEIPNNSTFIISKTSEKKHIQKSRTFSSCKRQNHWRILKIVR